MSSKLASNGKVMTFITKTINNVGTLEVMQVAMKNILCLALNNINIALNQQNNYRRCYTAESCSQVVWQTVCYRVLWLWLVFSLFDNLNFSCVICHRTICLMLSYEPKGWGKSPWNTVLRLFHHCVHGMRYYLNTLPYCIETIVFCPNMAVKMTHFNQAYFNHPSFTFISPKLQKPIDISE